MTGVTFGTSRYRRKRRMVFRSDRDRARALHASWR